MRTPLLAALLITLPACASPGRATPAPQPLHSHATPRPVPAPPASPTPAPPPETARPDLAGPPLAAAEAFAIPDFGPAADGYSPPRAQWEPKRRLRIVRIECTYDDSPKARARPPVARREGEAPELPPMVCRAGWRRKLGANLASSTSTFDSANEELARLQACHPLVERTAPRQLLDALVPAMWPGSVPRPDPSSDAAPPPVDPKALERALIAASENQPTVFAVHSLQRVGVYEHCQVLDCQMNPGYRPKFVRFQDVEELQLMAADGESTRQLYVPSAPSSAKLTMLDDGSASAILVEARAGRWTAAEKLAKQRAADTRGGAPLAHGLALANLAVARAFTGNAAGLREPVDAFNQLALPKGRSDVAAAAQSIAQADEYATGMRWLGVDPCARLQR